jgi:hypothetical protein
VYKQLSGSAGSQVGGSRRAADGAPDIGGGGRATLTAGATTAAPRASVNIIKERRMARR